MPSVTAITPIRWNQLPPMRISKLVRDLGFAWANVGGANIGGGEEGRGCAAGGAIGGGMGTGGLWAEPEGGAPAPLGVASRCIATSRLLSLIGWAGQMGGT